MTARRAHARRGIEPWLRILVVAALVVDAVVHFQLADTMQLAAPGGVGGGTLFRIQATVAAIAAAVLLLTGRRFAYAIAAVAALSAFIPVMVYTYVQVPMIGPIPSMYDPAWYPAKLASALAEAAAAILATIGFIVTSPRRGSWYRRDNAAAGRSAQPQ